MKNLFFVLTLSIGFGIFATSCGETQKPAEEEKKEETKVEEKKEEPKAPDFNAFFDKFKAAVNNKDYSMIEFPLFLGGLDKKELKEADLKGADYQQIFKDMKELTDLKMGALDEKELDAYLKEHFTKKFGNLNDIQMVKSAGPEYFYAYFKLMGTDYKLVGLHYVPGGM